MVLEIVVELGGEFADEFRAASESAAEGGAFLGTAADVKQVGIVGVGVVAAADGLG